LDSFDADALAEQPERSQVLATLSLARREIRE